MIGLVLMLLSHIGYIPKGHTSILCDDPSINRMFTGDTVPMTALLLMSTITPFLNILLLEWALPRSKARNLREATDLAWRFFKDLFFGQLVALLIIEFFKMTVSEARPHFMQTCKPNISEELCANGYVQLTWQNCTNPFDLSKGHVLDTMKSFPSGHAGLGAFIAAYMSWYLLTRLRVEWSRLLAISTALLWMLWGALCGVSRIWDNKHHWWDVMVGAAIGVLGAYATIRYLSQQFVALSRRSSAEQIKPVIGTVSPTQHVP